MSFENEQLRLGSVALHFDVKFQKAAARIAASQQIYWDNVAGGHALFSEFSLLSSAQGTLEQMTNYPRFLKTTRVCSMDEQEIGFTSATACEGCLPSIAASQGFLRGRSDADYAINLSLQPHISLNVSPQQLLPYEKVGDMRLRLRLADVNQVLFGAGVDATTTYTVSNLRLEYEVAPMDKDAGKQPIILVNHVSARDVLETNRQSVQQLVPQKCDAFVASCISLDDEGSTTKNYLDCQAVPAIPRGQTQVINHHGFSRMQVNINNADLSLSDYPFESQSEIKMNAARVFSAKPVNNMLKNQYAIGLPYGSLVDMSSQAFTLDLESSITNADKRSIYVYHRAIATI